MCKRNENILASLAILANIFAAKWNVVSDTSKVLLNDIFAELDGSSGIKNIITDRSVKSLKSWWIPSR